MRESSYYKYGKEYYDKISKMLSVIDEIEEEIKNIKTDYNDYPNKLYEDIIKFKYLPEIERYFQLNDGSVGNDIFIIRYLLHDLLVYIYIVKEKDLSEEEQNICSSEIEIRFYLFLNCIYNLKEKLKKFFNFDSDKKCFRDNILSIPGKENILNIFNKSYKKIENYCIARGQIVHDIYNLKYNILKNNIYIFCSHFDFSETNVNSNTKKGCSFNLEDEELVSTVMELQIMRKKVIEIILDIGDNIDLEKLKNKFNYEKGYKITG